MPTTLKAVTVLIVMAYLCAMFVYLYKPMGFVGLALAWCAVLTMFVALIRGDLW